MKRATRRRRSRSVRREPKPIRPRLRLVVGDEIAIGPGKAELLELIAATGSIAAAGRAMGMSYKRAWLLVDTMNQCFREPLITSSRGGSDQGGAELTETGRIVLASYRRMLGRLAASADLELIQRYVTDE